MWRRSRIIISVRTGEVGKMAAFPARFSASLISCIKPTNREGGLESGPPWLRYCLPCQEDLRTLRGIIITIILL